jgi:hypothetical protein
MEIEKGGNELPEHIQEIFEAGAKLNHDVANTVLAIEAWFTLYGSEKKPAVKFADLLFHYKEATIQQYGAEVANAILDRSDPEAVAKFDAIIDEMRKKVAATTVPQREDFQEDIDKLRKLVESSR